MSELLVPVLVMLALVFSEACILHFMLRQKVDWLDVIFNINSGHIVLWLFRCLEVLCYGMVLNLFSLNLFEGLPVVWLWLFTLLAWDFGFYWLHRLHHQLKPLWAVHLVHHQGEHYNLSLGVRNSWYSSLTSIPFFLVLAILGVPLSIFLAVSIAHYSVQFFNHNALTPKLGWLENVFVTPSHHRVHHLNEKRYADTNYGGTFIFWDKLFGTFSPMPCLENRAYGVKGRRASFNPMRESNLPFLQLTGILNNPRERHRQYDSAVLMIVIGTVLLFALVFGYIQRYGYRIDRLGAEQVLMFSLLVAGSVALGAISDGHRWGLFVWNLVTLSLSFLFLAGWGWSEAYWLVIVLALNVHGIAFALGFGRTPVRGKRELV
ncbi:sterol desaturase family protein [Enterobacter cloacae]|uniref:sterol desaturase family protein n=1 Tax=Enterobacter cloacae TaxID=550 RepID=UPI002549D2B1|nr:sterol desaturase family protein [Enterobacter cloacae]ELV2782744.1 sterol desaturase family protein [Enterobacter cloacae]